MGDMAEEFRAMKEFSRKSRKNRRDFAPNFLKKHHIQFEQFTDAHLRVGEWDFWPGTGKFKHMRTGESGRGIENLVKRVKR